MARTGTVPHRPPVERLSSADRAMWGLSARGRVPEQLGAVLVLAPSGEPDPAAIGRSVAARLAGVPRLRQRVVRPPGAGRPSWLEVPGFDAARHVRRLPCPAPGDEQALLDLAASTALEPLDRSRPLWAAVLVTGLRGGRVGLVLVVSHVVADGIGGLAVLARLVDPPAGAAPRPAGPPARPRGRPPYRRLALDGLRSLRAGGGLHPPAAAACSLLVPTGGRRRFAVARTDLRAVHAAAAAVGATVNDAVLAATAGALRDLLATRGESVADFRVAVMVAGDRPRGDAPGNAAAPLVVTVPSAGTGRERLRAVAGRVHRTRAAAAGPPPMALLGPLFRLAVATGLYHRWLRRQHRFHTLVSNVHGPDRPVTVAGAPVEAIIPFAVGDSGNAAVQFVCLSYAGALTVTAVADPDRLPELPLLAGRLQAELDAVAAPPTDAVRN